MPQNDASSLQLRKASFWNLAKLQNRHTTRQTTRGGEETFVCQMDTRDTKKYTCEGFPHTKQMFQIIFLNT